MDKLEPIKRKLNELDSKFDKLIEKDFAYHTAILQILQDKGIITRKEMIQYLEHHKRGFKRISEDVEFWKIAQQIKGKRRK